MKIADTNWMRAEGCRARDAGAAVPEGGTAGPRAVGEETRRQIDER